MCESVLDLLIYKARCQLLIGSIMIKNINIKWIELGKSCGNSLLDMLVNIKL